MFVFCISRISLRSAVFMGGRPGCLFGAYQRLRPEAFPYCEKALTETLAANASADVAAGNLRAFAAGLHAFDELDDNELSKGYTYCI